MKTYGKYEITKKIGEGGFGAVYLGWDPVLDREVAIKTVIVNDAQARERFVREAKTVASLQHPNLVTVFDFGVEDNEPYLVQELLQGEDLSDILARKESVDLEVKVRYLAEISDGLAHAHDAKVIHRDVKPSNVRILPDGRVKLLDFGIAKVADATQLTQPGASIGTVAYVAPEALRGEAVDHRADIFSLGIVAYELLTGTLPFTGDGIVAVFFKIAHVDPDPIRDIAPGIPAELASIIERCLAKDPADRPQSCGELAASLRGLDGELLSVSATGPLGEAAETVVIPRPPLRPPSAQAHDPGTAVVAIPSAKVPMRLPRSLLGYGGAAAVVAVVAFFAVDMGGPGMDPNVVSGAATDTGEAIASGAVGADSLLEGDGQIEGDGQPSAEAQDSGDRGTTASGGEVLDPAPAEDEASPAAAARRGVAIRIEGAMASLLASTLGEMFTESPWEEARYQISGDVLSSAGEARSGFFTGTATVTLVVEDLEKGERRRINASVGDGRTPGKLAREQGAAERAAVEAAAQMVADSLAAHIGQGG